MLSPAFTISTEWKPKGSMINERTNDLFVSDEASVSMSRDGNTIAIGSSRNSHEAKNAVERYHGRVRVLSFEGGEWVKLGSDIYGTQGFSHFGKSISLDEDGLILAVGAEGTNFNMGEVKVFKYDSEEWVQVDSDIPGPSKDSYFGSSIALSSSEDGLLVAAGAYGAGLSVISDSLSSIPTTSPSASPTKTHSARPTESPTTAPTKSFAPTSTNIAGLNSDEMSTSVHMSKSTKTKATSAFIISVFAAIFFSFKSIQVQDVRTKENASPCSCLTIAVFSAIVINNT